METFLYGGISALWHPMYLWPASSIQCLHPSFKGVEEMGTSVQIYRHRLSGVCCPTSLGAGSRLYVEPVMLLVLSLLLRRNEDTNTASNKNIYRVEGKMSNLFEKCISRGPTL